LIIAIVAQHLVSQLENVQSGEEAESVLNYRCHLTKMRRASEVLHVYGLVTLCFENCLPTAAAAARGGNPVRKLNQRNGDILFGSF
jgi:hypothetical protein